MRPASPARVRACGLVLLVTDGDGDGHLVHAHLERDGFQVLRLTRRDRVFTELARQPVRLVLLDMAPPESDGFEVCRQIRRHSPVPILMLAARSSEADRVAGLEAGADDFLRAPVSPRELLARVNSLLRRTGSLALERTLELGDVVLRRGAHEVEVGGTAVALTAKEFGLLDCLLEHQGLVLSREQLLDRIWGGAFPGGTRTVDVHVAQLRRKLGRPALIRTVRGVGYKAVGT